MTVEYQNREYTVVINGDYDTSTLIHVTCLATVDDVQCAHEWDESFDYEYTVEVYCNENGELDDDGLLRLIQDMALDCEMCPQCGA